MARSRLISGARSVPDRSDEVAIHRPIAADVPEPGKQQPAEDPSPRTTTKRPLDSNVMMPSRPNSFDSRSPRKSDGISRE